jgi:hypothetical protein
MLNMYEFRSILHGFSRFVFAETEDKAQKVIDALGNREAYDFRLYDTTPVTDGMYFDSDE